MTFFFRALRIHELGSGTEARLESITPEDINPGEIGIRVAYSGINYKDALAITGRNRIMRSYPKVPGIDLAGTVERSATSRFAVGHKVLVTGCNIGEVLDGGMTEYVRVPADAVVAVPEGLDLRESMALGTAGFTAALAIRRMLENHQKPEMGPIAVTGATGGVGSIAISILKQLGFTVAAITGKPSTASHYLKLLGADKIIDRTTLDVGTRPLEKAIWGGAVDNLGGETLTWLMRTTGKAGNIASIGLAQGHAITGTGMPFILRGITLLGINSVEVPRTWREEIWQQLAGPWKPVHLSDQIAVNTVNLEKVPETCEALIRGNSCGRTVVRIADS